MALRDWGRVRERIELHVEWRHLGYFTIASVCALGGAFALGTQQVQPPVPTSQAEPVAKSVSGTTSLVGAAIGKPRPDRPKSRQQPIVPRSVSDKLRAAVLASGDEQRAAESAANPHATGVWPEAVRSEPARAASVVSCGLAADQRPCTPAGLGLTSLVGSDGAAIASVAEPAGSCEKSAGTRQQSVPELDLAHLKTMQLKSVETAHRQALDRARRDLAWLAVEQKRRRLEALTAASDASAAENHLLQLEERAKATATRISELHASLEATEKRRLEKLAQAEAAERRVAAAIELEKAAQARVQAAEHQRELVENAVKTGNQQLAQAQREVAQKRAEAQRMAQTQARQAAEKLAAAAKAKEAKLQEAKRVEAAQRLAQKRQEEQARKVAQAKAEAERKRIAEAQKAADRQQKLVAVQKAAQARKQAEQKRAAEAKRVAAARKVTRPAAPSKPKTPSAATPKGRRYYVQVKAFKSAAEAQAFVSVLRGKGYRPLVTKLVVPKRGVFYRVRLGPFPSHKAASDKRRVFESKEPYETMVMSS